MIVLLVVCFSAKAQHTARNVPAIVLNAFQQEFPKARQVEWEQRKDGSFEVEFNMGMVRRDQKVFFSPDGTMLKHEEELPASALPDVIRDQLRTAFDGYRVDEVRKIEEFGKITYAVDLERPSGDLKVLFGADGKVLKERMD